MMLQQQQEHLKSMMEQMKQMFPLLQPSKNKNEDKKKEERQVVEAEKDDLSKQLSSVREGHNTVERKQIPGLEGNFGNFFPPESPHFEERDVEGNSGVAPALTDEKPLREKLIKLLKNNRKVEEEEKPLRREGSKIFDEYDDYDDDSRGKECIEEVGKAEQSSLVLVPERYCLREINIQQFQAFQKMMLQQQQEHLKSMMELMKQMFLLLQPSKNKNEDKKQEERQVVKTEKDVLSKQLSSQQFQAFQKTMLQQQQEHLKSMMELMKQMFLLLQPSKNKNGDKKKEERQVVEAEKDDLSKQLSSQQFQAFQKMMLQQQQEHLKSMMEQMKQMFPLLQPSKNKNEDKKKEERQVVEAEKDDLSKQLSSLLKNNPKVEEGEKPLPTEGSKILNEYDDYDDDSRGKECIEEVWKAEQSSLVLVPERYCLREINSKSSMTVRTLGKITI
ncbi:golgin subfamily A member 6-like protein 22 [Musca domestica]|uniref:Golgin subfamily A member 6-like protein 22 n=1 Tax=Musca domestica TaxID=7370 RepID=A0ABM3VEB4_MUSDO|nr:golgin subfamily A member 6-like protein 22 [Musca domestica]